MEGRNLGPTLIGIEHAGLGVIVAASTLMFAAGLSKVDWYLMNQNAAITYSLNDVFSDVKAACGTMDGEDLDGDNLPNSCEDKLGTRPDRVDSDGDLIPDSLELKLGTDPLSLDSDGDGVSDGFDSDTTGLGVSRKFKIRKGIDANSLFNLPIGGQLLGAHAAVDSCSRSCLVDFVSSGGRLTVHYDEGRVVFKRNDLQGKAQYIPGSTSDFDKDDLNYQEELKHKTDPEKADTDGDGFNDGGEVRAGSNPLD